MASAPAATLTDRQRFALEALVSDLRVIFSTRLHALVAYGLGSSAPGDGQVQTLCLVERVTFDDLAKAVMHVANWQRAGLAVPLILSHYEFERTLDIFPLEYGSIIANHIVIVGDRPFAGIQVLDADRRRACEQQAKSHLVHLREGFLETRGDQKMTARLITASAPAFRTLLSHLADLDSASVRSTEIDAEALAESTERSIGVPSSVVRDVLATAGGMSTVADPNALLSRYIDASERIWRHVDGRRT